MSPRPSAPPTSNRRTAPARSRAVPAGELAPQEESPVPGPATTTVRPKRVSKPPPKAAPSSLARAAQLVGGAFVVLGASISVAWGARHYVTTSPRFAVRTVLVDGVRKRSASQVATLGGVTVGKNIFALDLVNASQLMLQDPWIEKATVTRKLPSTVNVTVTEREAYALASIGGALYLATRDGELFKRLAEDDSADLPLVTGVTAEQVARDRAGVVLSVKRVLDVAEDMDRMGIGKRYPLQELHLEKDGSLVVTLGKEAILVHLGEAPYRAKIAQAARVLQEIARRKANASVIFVDNNAHPERVVARMR